MMDTLKPVLDTLYAPQAWLMGFSPYIYVTVIGIVIAAALGLAGFTLARMGHRPLWALLLLVPTAIVVALWVLAFTRFPRERL